MVAPHLSRVLGGACALLAFAVGRLVANQLGLGPPDELKDRMERSLIRQQSPHVVVHDEVQQPHAARPRAEPVAWSWQAAGQHLWACGVWLFSRLGQGLSLLLWSFGWVLLVLGYFLLAVLGLTFGTHVYVHVQACDARNSNFSAAMHYHTLRLCAFFP